MDRERESLLDLSMMCLLLVGVLLMFAGVMGLVIVVLLRIMVPGA